LLSGILKRVQRDRIKVAHVGHQNAGQNHNIKLLDYISSKDVVKFKYLGMTQMNQRCIQDEIKSRFCQHLLPSRLAFVMNMMNFKTVEWNLLYHEVPILNITWK
jgi:hypothetical protein